MRRMTMPQQAASRNTGYRPQAIYATGGSIGLSDKYIKLAAAFLLWLLFSVVNANGQSFQGKVSGPITQNGSGYVPGRIIVKFKNGIIPVETKNGNRITLGIPAVDRLNAQYNCTAVTRLNTGLQERNTNYTYKLDFATTADVQALIKEYMATGSMEYAEPDYIAGINTTTPNDPYFVYSWGLNNNGSFAYSSYTPVAGADMDMKRAWDITQGSSTITVAVIDAGAKLDHPEFSGRIWQNIHEIAGNGIDDDGNGYVDDYRGWNFVSSNNNPTDDNGHGTNVMGIIGANGNNAIGYAGVDWHCKLMVLKTQDASGSGSYSSMASAIYYATDNGAKVINMSLGGSASATTLQTAINYAYAHNVTVVAAMGNNNSSVPSYPGACTHVIAVGASTCADTRASFSNYGSHISVVAPGDVIFGLSYLSNTDYTSGMSGTSQATPAVTGVISLLLAQNPARTPDQLRNLIESTAEDQVGNPAEDVAGFDIYYGHGRVNAYAALLGCAAPVVGAISGTGAVCTGATMTLTDTTASGIWSSSNAAVATVASTGVVTGIAAGTVTISYAKTNACGTTVVTKAVTVNAPPAAITGTGALCPGGTATLSSITTGGTWSSSATSIATIGSSTGIATGISSGTSKITYSKAGCITTKVVTVSLAISAISGASAVCQGNTTTLSDATTGGSWMSSSPGIAAIGSGTGILSGISAGTATITYAAGSCNTTKQVTVYAAPATITGASSICTGTTATLSNSVKGGSWSSSNVTVAGISTSGIVTGLANGTTRISYIMPSGCYTTTIVTVSNSAPAITGSASLCIGTTTTLADATTGGTWSSSNTAVAGISTTGMVSGFTAGTTRISYIMPSGCYATTVVTVSNGASAITGSTSVCIGATTTLTDATTGGTWTSGNPTIASIGAGTGVVTGIAAGTAVITYSTASGCTATAIVTVTASPAPITGTPAVCTGTSVTLSDGVPGGTWSSSNAAIASINAAGTITGIAAGTANITYELSSSGCRAVTTVTVSGTVPAITGATSVCTGTTTAFADALAGGTWSSSNTALATVNTSGIVTGVAAGVATISYTLPGGCYRVQGISVKASPAPISGSTGVCVGGTSVVTDGSGVSWSSSNPAVATIGAASGVITGISPGTTSITFLATSGCTATKVATVDAAPTVPAIAGLSAVAVGSSITLSDAMSGGTWSSNNTARATVDASGVVTAVSVPAVTISYTVANGACRVSATKLITIVAAHKLAIGDADASGAELKVYPNPTSGAFNLLAPASGTLAIYTLDGREVMHSTVAEGSNSLNLPGGLTAGIYLCKFTGDDDNVITTRIMYRP